MRRWLIVGAVAAAAVAGWMVFSRDGEDDAPAYRFGVADRGDVLDSVSATGRLEPVGTVEIGSQLSGQIEEILVDFNDIVTAGQVIARLDASTYDQRVQVDAADLAVQNANVLAAQAQLVSAQADLRSAQREFERQDELVERGVASESALDTARATLDRARAAVSSAEASIEVNRARVLQAEAALASSRIDLERAEIRSSVDGVVIDRAIEVGQTVAASLQAPVLFVIAEDLSRMQVEVSVDEADIGDVREGLPVRFTVDAYLDEEFDGEVTQVRIQPTVESNVVTYTVIAETDNPTARLLPGMTANAEIVLEERRDVLRAPNTALRWSPPEGAAVANGAGDGRPAGGPSGGGPPGGGSGGRLQALVADLGLDAEQTAAVEAIGEDLRTRMQALFSEARAGGGDMESMRPRIAREMESALDQVAALLDADQRAQFAERRAEAESRRAAGPPQIGVVWTLDRRGRPSAVRVRLGVADAERTEIIEVLSGELADGAQVITGGGGGSTSSSTAQRGGFGRGRPPL